jgi:methylenetetrahydrofolate reductase (NADPH)
MLKEARRFEERLAVSPLRLGAAAALTPLPAWKRDADFLLAQVSFSVDQLLSWRSSINFVGPVYAGVLVVASAPMATKLGADFPQLTVPDWLVKRLEHDIGAGVDFACEMVNAIRDSGAFDGVHLIPVGRYRDVARRLESEL